MKRISSLIWFSLCLVLFGSIVKADVIENLSGGLSVTNGMLGYDFPLSIPAGLDGLQPGLNVSYVSSGSATNMGAGFALKVGMTIERCTASIRKDGYFAGLEQSSNTRFCRGGEKLVLVSGSNAESGSVYKSYVDNNSKFIADGGSQYTPDFWIEKTSAGHTLTYTKTDQFDAKKAQWLLTKKEDGFGNKIVYSYLSGDQTLIDEITYNFNKVKVNYEDREREITGYSAGKAVKAEKRVKSVSMFFENTEAWSYQFEYETVGLTLKQDRLKAIEKCYGESNANGCTKPLSFQYESQPKNTSAFDRPEDRTIVIPRSFYTLASYENESPWDRPSYAAADLNNDGFPEFCYYKLESGVYCAIYNGSGYDLPTSWSANLGYSANKDHSDQYAYFSNLKFLDLNDDNYVDLCFIDDKGVRCALNQNGSSFGSFQYWNTSLVSDSGVVFEKLTHDNKPEFCGVNQSNKRYECYENNGTEASSLYYQLDSLISFEKEIKWISRDVMSRFSQSNSKSIEYNAPFWIDINNDLARDICWVDVDVNLSCKLVTRSVSTKKIKFSNIVKKFSFSDYEKMPSVTNEVYEFSDSLQLELQADTAIKHSKLLKASLRVADINGDTNIDICYVDPDKKFKCSINDGNTFQLVQQWSDFSALPSDKSLYEASLATLSFSDENYDGLPDLCSLHSRQRWCALNTGQELLDFEAILSISPDFDYNQQSSKAYDNFIRSLFKMKTLYRSGVGSSSFGNPLVVNDINGDKNPEFCYRSINGVMCTDLDNYAPTHKLVGVTNSFGQQTDINYGLYIADGLYDDSLPVPSGYIKTLAERELVDSVTTDSGAYVNGAVIRNTAKYRYGHMLADNKTRSFGYSHLIVENPQRQQKTVSSLYLDPDLLNQEKVIKQYISGVLVNEKVNTVTKKISDWNTVQIEVNNTSETQYDLDGIELSKSETKFEEYDEYGFVLKQTYMKEQAGEFLKTSTVNIFLNDTNNWHLGLPISNTATHTDSNGDIISRSVEFTYENGLPKTETIAPGNDDQQIITYTYNSKGLPEKVSTIVDGKIRFISKKYDEFSRLKELTNALGQTESYEYERWCGPSVVTDIAGRKNTTEYNALCQKISSYNEIDANVTTWDVGWHSDIDYNSVNIPTSVRNPVVYKLTQTAALGAESVSYFDANGRKVRTSNKTTAPQGDTRYALQDVIFDRYGRTVASTKPYFELNGNPDIALWTHLIYDDINRIKTKTSNGPNGLPMIVSNTYSSNSVTQSYSDYSKTTVTGIHGNPVEITENDLTVKYKYNPIGDLVETDRDDQITILKYDSRGQKSKQIDPSMGTWEYDHNGFGELIWQKDAKGQVTTYEYDLLGRQISRTDINDTTVFRYNNSGSGSGQIDSEETSDAIRTYNYDDSGRLKNAILEIDSKTFTTEYQYDGYSRLLSTLHPDGLAIMNSYDEVGALKTFSIPSKDFTDYNYVALKEASDGLLEATVRLELQIDALEQKALSHTEKANYYRNQIAYFSSLYDSQNASISRLQEIATSHDDQAKALYLKAADLRREAQAVLAKIGNPKKTMMKYKGVVNGEYRFTKKWCSRHKKNWYGRKRCVTRDYRTIYLTQANLNPTDPSNPIYLFSKSPRGKYKPHVVLQNAAKKFDQLAKIQVEKAEAARDKLNAPDAVRVYMPKVEQHQSWVLIGIDIPVPVEVTVTTRKKQWQFVSRATAIAHYKEQRDYFQELLNLEILKKDIIIGNISTLASDLLAAQNAFELFESNLSGLNIGVDELEGIVMHREEWQSKNKQLAIWMAAERNASGQIKSELYGNGLFTRKDYNQESGAVDAIVTGTYSGQVMRHLEYDYNDRGLINTKSDTTTEGNYQYETFGYDRQGRLTEWKFDQTLTGASDTKIKAHSRSYEYDDWGNMTFKTDAGEMNYDPSSGRLYRRQLKDQSYSYSYDANGNMLAGDGRNYTWTSFNKIATVSNGQQVAYRYDAGQRRVSKTTGDNVTYYVSPTYEVTISSNNETRHRHNIVVGDDVVATYERFETGIDTSDQIVYYHRDIIGSGELITGSDMEVVARRYYTPYGENIEDILGDDDSIINDGAEVVINVDDDYKQLILTNIEEDDTFTLLSEIQVRDSERLNSLRGYTSHENVAEVGLINMNARHFDPVTARFVSADSMVPGLDQPLAYNRYAYVSGNPVSYRDPSGHFFIGGIGILDQLYMDSQMSDNKNYQMATSVAVATVIAVSVGPVVTNGVAGAMAGAAISSLSMSFLAKGEITREDVGSAGIAAASAGVTYGIGHSGAFETNSWQQFTAHAIAQGTFSHIRGHKFIDGAVAGLAGKAAASATSFDGVSGRGHIFTRTMIAGSMGALAARLTTGDVDRAFVIAASVHLFNQEAGRTKETAQKGNGVIGHDADGVPIFDESHPRFHSYYGSNSCLKASGGCTYANGKGGLLRFPAPGASGQPIADEQTGFAIPVGTVRHEVYDGGAQVINVTLEGKHILHPGIVRRWVTQDVLSVTVHTYGEGTGPLPGPNVFFSESLWRSVDNNIFDYMSQQ